MHTRAQRIEECLSVIWEEKEKGITERQHIAKAIAAKVKEDYIDELLKDGYAIEAGSSIGFTAKGESVARDVIRRQRLAERLLIDVLEVTRHTMDSSACEFEHILSKEVEESICTLLGHPKECPHGLPIPSGECCAKAGARLESIVVPVAKLKPGEVGKIVYVLTHKHPQLHKLMSLGIVPGVNLSVHQVSPSFVIQVEETQVALEEEIAREIYVKRLGAA
jgi:DtxR family Mn-dependent transcriptional regulator